MAKDKKKKVVEDVGTEIKKKKKKVFMAIGALAIIAIGIGSFFAIKSIGESKAQKSELLKLDIKDYPVDEKEIGKIYSRDIAKQTYILKNGAISFECTLVFYNKLGANLYNGITDRDEQVKTEPDSTLTGVFGEKLAKDAINKFLQNTSKESLSSTDTLSEGLKKSLNKQFKDTFGQEIIKDVLVTHQLAQ